MRGDVIKRFVFKTLFERFNCSFVNYSEFMYLIVINTVYCSEALKKKKKNAKDKKSEHTGIHVDIYAKYEAAPRIIWLQFPSR